MFNTSLERIFGVQKYANALSRIVRERDIQLNFKRNLIEIRPETKEAIFEVLDDSQSEKKILETYSVQSLFVEVFSDQYIYVNNVVVLQEFRYYSCSTL